MLSAKEWAGVAADEPGSVLLQRAPTRRDAGRSMLFREPVKVIETRHPEEVGECLAAADEALAEDYFVAGYVGYEAGFALEPSLADVGAMLQQSEPLLWLGCYRRPAVEAFRWDAVEALGMGAKANPQWSMPEREYARRVEEVRSLIAAGETYQANLTMELRWRTDESAAALYERLLRAQPVRYAALLHPMTDWRVLSLSPELFFARDGERIMTRPMKGTASTGLDAKETRVNAAWLKADEKNRAENVMIVDLLRSDLGRICRMGSVRVTELFEVERYATVLQMTSTVEGQLREETGYREIFRALFPSGSIVGAPKIHTMRLLRALEGRARGVYTGAIGYMAPGGEAEFNVAIRTISLRGNEARLGVGSGIVYDSDAATEYQECRIKTLFVTREPTPEFELIETLLLEEGAYTLLEEHLERMEDSAEYFDMAFERAQVREALDHAALQSAGGERMRVRLLMGRDGSVRWSAARMRGEEDGPVALLLRRERTDPMDRFLRHKTTQRALYDEAWQDAQRRGYADALFCNVREEITEGAIHNVMVVMEGEWLTPPLTSGVLPGVFRRRMLEKGRVAERVLRLRDLQQAEEIYVCNSVRGLRRVVSVETQRGDGMERVWRDEGLCEQQG